MAESSAVDMVQDSERGGGLSDASEKAAAYAENPTPQNAEALRAALIEDWVTWARVNNIRVPPNVLYGPPVRRAHYRRTANGWLENVLLINRCGFEKAEEIEADSPGVLIPVPYRLNLMKIGSMDTPTREHLHFVRTRDVTPDGRAIYREDGWFTVVDGRLQPMPI